MSKNSSECTHRPAASTLEGSEKVREGHPSPSAKRGEPEHIGLPEILRHYYGMWLGGHWTRFEDVQDAGAGG